MINYSSLPYVDGSSALWTAKATNVSTSGGVDGTGLQAAIFNQNWGMHQAALKLAGISPNGLDEEADSSQIIEAIRNITSPPGTVIAGMWNDDPASLGIRALPLAGQLITVADYGDLVANVWVGTALNATADCFFRTNSVVYPYSRSDSGIYMLLPDLRGSFLRNSVEAGTGDPNGDREVGELQSSYLQRHEHAVLDDTRGFGCAISSDPYVADASGNFVMVATGVGGSHNVEGVTIPATNDSGNSVNLNDEQTAPINHACRFAIIY